MTAQASGGRGWLDAGGCVAAGAFQVCGDVLVYQEAMAGAGRRLGVQYGSGADTGYTNNDGKHEPADPLTVAARRLCAGLNWRIQWVTISGPDRYTPKYTYDVFALVPGGTRSGT